MKSRKYTLNDDKTVSSVSSINILGYKVGNGIIAPDPERLQPLLDFPPPQNQRALKRTLGLFAYYAKWLPNFADKVKYLRNTKQLPLDDAALKEFHDVKKELCKATLKSIDEDQPFIIECDASDVAVSATLNQGTRPVAFMSRALQGSSYTTRPLKKKQLPLLMLFASGHTFWLVNNSQL